ncbi:MAG: division/cell wall cluster transcriptional repressor MraZ [Ferrimicrobium sp.]
MWPSGEVAAKFFGAYTHTLDVKGRLTLPARFRSHFTDRCYVTPSQFEDTCLVIWTEADFVAFVNRVTPQQWEVVPERRRLRRWAREAYELEIDRLGRVGLPNPLRQLARLDREALVQGAFGTVEIWNPQVWEIYEASDRDEGVHDA